MTIDYYKVFTIVIGKRMMTKQRSKSVNFEINALVMGYFLLIAEVILYLLILSKPDWTLPWGHIVAKLRRRYESYWQKYNHNLENDFQPFLPD